MHLNHTTPHISPQNNTFELLGYYVLIPIVVLTLIGCVVATVVYIQRRSRLDELRHRLIPLCRYDTTWEEDDWGDAGREEEEELAEPLYREAQLSFASGNQNMNRKKIQKKVFD
ncbi:small integral membrane protein 29-like [Brachyistius frenatus]|uniref:small integral membrane protein 29-like n=1 Tax=Brachyistius frenatus TaxID=100188 RepID=UPI0037E708D5